MLSGSVAGFTRADLRAVEKEQMRRLLEQPLPHSMQASQAIAPVMSLAGCWSPVPACDDAMTAAVSSHWPLLPEDEQLQLQRCLSHDLHPLLHRSRELQLPSPPVSPPADSSYAFANVLSYSATGDSFPAFAPAAAAASRKRALDEDELLPSFLKRSVSSISASSASELQLLSAPLPLWSSGKKLSSSGAGGDGHRAAAAYPLLSSAVVDGFFASSVNMSGSVMGGLDDAELGLLPPAAEREVKAEKVKECSSGDRQSNAKQPSMPQLLPSSWLPPPPLPVQSPSRPLQLSTASHSSTASCASSTQSSVSSFFSAAPLHASSPSAASTAVSSPVSSAAAEASALETDGASGGEGGRRAKRRLTDKQRRAKIKDGLEQLRSLVALHGSSSSDQAAIVNSSVDLVQQLVSEKEQLRQQLRLLREERADIERQQHALRMTAAAVLSSSSSPSPSAAVHPADAQQPKLGFLFQHLLNVLNANAGGAGGEGADVTAIDQLLLSQYLHMLHNVNKAQRNAFNSM